VITPLHSAEQAALWLHERGCVALHSDSRHVRQGDGFIAWSGAHHDARQYVITALDQGANAAVIDSAELPTALSVHWPAQLVGALDQLKHHCGEVASAFYGHPSKAIPIVAVTGTNGKTSTTWWLAQAMSLTQRTCGLVGTLGVGMIGQLSNTGLTTPQAVELQAALADMVQQGASACAMEASSIGLAESRLQGTHISVAVFTNFTQDHLDYHGDMARYWEAKRALFTWAGLRSVVINIDDAKGAALACELNETLDIWTVSRERTARLWARSITSLAQGTAIEIVEQADAQVYTTNTPLIGHYNVSNLLCVLASMRALGVPLAQAIEACESLTPVPGRLQTVGHDSKQPLVLVDYAHTPDALTQVLGALQPIARARQGQLWCVVGCGGDRDASKRAPMAAAAESGANVLVLTSDNPRSEDPNVILEAMMVGLRAPAHAVCADRAQAIALVVAQAQVQDVILIAGKGHEDYQEILGQRLPFNDHDVALAALHARSAGGMA
jgi:UDP-N-acetylmuramyl-tripeptide synthetase